MEACGISYGVLVLNAYRHLTLTLFILQYQYIQDSIYYEIIHFRQLD